MIDLWKVKENFSSLVVETEPWTLAQFVMWLDLKISEYKIKGFMVLDHNNTTKPRWMSPDTDTDPETDIAPQPPPCRKCDKGENPQWAPHLISHQPPSRHNQMRENKRQRFESHYENYTSHDKTHMGRRKDIEQSQYSSEFTQSHPNTTVIDLENMPEMGKDGGNSEFVLAEVKQEDFENSIAEMSVYGKIFIDTMKL
ncbi:hypothetical protein KUTeg_015243 [Tegillarca granosa]|uniref:Uncharacterized protein n=1 Tax=Tegillarca granosa TaxID=220873 RepID=A0ABQ9EPK7_TEGGR|nr:hypothetical protein KUTeg_015243 [Tegillarca granosa]